VSQLQGALYEWVNSGRPVVRPGQRTPNTDKETLVKRFLKKLLAGLTTSRTPRPATRSRLGIEALEARWAPAAISPLDAGLVSGQGIVSTGTETTGAAYVHGGYDLKQMKGV